MKIRWLSRFGLVLVVAELLLVLLSWLLSAQMVEGVRSLLSLEGVRWLLGRFVRLQLHPLLVWLLLGGMAMGCIVSSNILSDLRHERPLSYRSKMALRVSILLLLVYVGLIVLLTATPHAALLSVIGTLFPSPFSDALIPLVAFAFMLVGLSYGWATGRLSKPEAMFVAMANGVGQVAPWLVLYVPLVLFYESLYYVFSLA